MIKLISVKAVLRKEALLDKVTLHGSGKNWEVEAPNQRIANKVKKALRKKGVLTGGFTTGYGGEIIKNSGLVKDFGDYNDKGSKWHY